MNTLKVLRKRKNITLARMANDLNLAISTISQYESGKRQPNNEMLITLSKYFGVSIDYILAKEEKKGYRIPVLCSIPAGVPLEAIQDIDDWEEIPESWLLGGKEYFAFKVKGESMMPKYNNGDVVIMIKQSFYDNGDDCIAFIDGQEATFKRIKTNDKGITLQPLNSDFEPLFFTNEQIENIPIRVIGKAVEIRRKI